MRTPSDVVRVGDEVAVVVTEIDVERRRPALSRRQASSEYQ
ncbi:S1 RNA-binding domain-containing protein [Streptomyces tibetensis]